MNIKIIRRELIEIFEAIERIKQILTEVKKSGTNVFSSNDELQYLINKLEKKYLFLNDKKTITFIKKRISKRKNRNKSSKENYYDLKLNDMLKDKSVFGPRFGRFGKEENRTENSTQLVDALNKSLNDLRELKEFSTCVSKLVLVRSKQKDQIRNNNQINNVLDLIENQRIVYEKNKKSLKGNLK